MSDCDICKIVEHKDVFNFIYEDDKAFAIVHESPAVPGHVLVIPKKHMPIFEELPDEMVQHCFQIANVISMKIFENLGAKGTNIIVNNGTAAGQEQAHFMIHVIPRQESDPLNFEWTPKKVTEESLNTTLSMIKTFTDVIFEGKDVDPSKTQILQEPEEDNEDYLTKQLKRVP